MIDLSFLTEEEQEMIALVLKRDAELKKVEDQRVKELQKTVRDRSRLKYMTGEWFYETKSRRHRDRIHGSDIIRASIRARKPVTILELSKIWPENPSFVNSGNQEVFIPPELAGLIEEPPVQSQNQSRDNACSPQSQPDGLKPAVQPIAKARQNPFNNEPASLSPLDEASRWLSNGTPLADTTPAGELLPPHESPIITLTNQISESSEKLQATLNPVKPVPRKRILHISSASVIDSNEPACKQEGTYAPRSILKHNSSISSSDSLKPRSHGSQKVEPLSSLDLPDSPGSELSLECWLDRKQVRFSGIKGRNTALQNSQEPDEFDFLDHNDVVYSDEEGQTDRSDTSISSSSGDSSESLSSLREECDSPVFSETLQRTKPELPMSSKSFPKDSDLWNSNLVNCEKVKSGELQNNAEDFHQKSPNEAEALRPTDFHDGLAEPPASEVSNQHTRVAEPGKTDESEPGSPFMNLTEEESNFLDKALDWLTQSFGQSGRFQKRNDMEESRKDHEHVDELESKSTQEEILSGSQKILKPSPKPRRGFLAFFSGAEEKKGCPEMITPVEGKVSYPAEDTEATCQDEEVEEDKNMTKQEELGTPVVYSTNQRILCDVKENCDQTGSFSSASLQSFKGSKDRTPNILTMKEEKLASGQGNQYVVGQEEQPKAGQNVLLDTKNKKSKVSPSLKPRKGLLLKSFLTKKKVKKGSSDTITPFKDVSCPAKEKAYAEKIPPVEDKVSYPKEEEVCSEKITSIEDKVSYPTENKEAACQDDPVVLSKVQATLTSEKERTAASGQENYCVVGQKAENPRAGQNVFSYKNDESSKDFPSPKPRKRLLSKSFLSMVKVKKVSSDIITPLKDEVSCLSKEETYSKKIPPVEDKVSYPKEEEVCSEKIAPIKDKVSYPTENKKAACQDDPVVLSKVQATLTSEKERTAASERENYCVVGQEAENPRAGQNVFSYKNDESSKDFPSPKPRKRLLSKSFFMMKVKKVSSDIITPVKDEVSCLSNEETYYKKIPPVEDKVSYPKEEEVCSEKIAPIEDKVSYPTENKEAACQDDPVVLSKVQATLTSEKERTAASEQENYCVVGQEAENPRAGQNVFSYKNDESSKVFPSPKPRKRLLSKSILSKVKVKKVSSDIITPVKDEVSCPAKEEAYSEKIPLIEDKVSYPKEEEIVCSKMIPPIEDTVSYPTENEEAACQDYPVALSEILAALTAEKERTHVSGQENQYAVGQEAENTKAGHNDESSKVCPAPKPRKGLLSIFSRAEVKEGSSKVITPVKNEVSCPIEEEACSEKITPADDEVSYPTKEEACSEKITPVENKVSYPTEDKEAVCQDVPMSLSEVQATLTVEKEGTPASGQENQCAVEQESENPKSSQNVFSDKKEISSKASPSPKPKKGLLSFFSRAEVKEGSSEVITPVKDEVSCPTEEEAYSEKITLVKDKVSHPTEDKEAACQGVSVVLSEVQAALTLEKEGTAASGQENHCAVKQEAENPKARQNVFSDKIEKSSEVSPSPKPRKGLSFFSRAEVKEGSSDMITPIEVSCPTEEETCSEKIIPVEVSFATEEETCSEKIIPVEDKVSYPTEEEAFSEMVVQFKDEISFPTGNKDTTCQDVPVALSEVQATLTVEKEGTAASGQESEHPKTGQNVFSDKKEKYLKVSPSPKPRKGLLSFFSRAEVKEGSSEVITSVNDKVSCPTEEEACSEKTTPVNDEVSSPIEDKEAVFSDIPVVLSEAQATLSVENQCAVGQESEDPKAGQNVFSDKKEKSSGVCPSPKPRKSFLSFFSRVEVKEGPSDMITSSEVSCPTEEETCSEKIISVKDKVSYPTEEEAFSETIIQFKDEISFPAGNKDTTCQDVPVALSEVQATLTVEKEGTAASGQENECAVGQESKHPKEGQNAIPDKNEKSSKVSLSPKPSRGLLAFFSRAEVKEGSSEVIEPVKEEVSCPTEEEACYEKITPVDDEMSYPIEDKGAASPDVPEVLSEAQATLSVETQCAVGLQSEDLKAGQNDFSDKKEISSKVSPSPKPKRGLLAFFSRAEVKERSSEVIAPVKEEVSCPTEEEACYEKITPVDDEVSYPIEDKGAASPDVPEVLSEAQATLSVENQCAVGLQPEDLKAGQNDFSDKKEISSKVSPSPKPKRGLLAFLSRAEVKEGSSEVIAPVKEVSCPTEEEACYEKITPVDDEVSYPIEDKVAASPAVPEVLSETQATLSVENQCAVGLQSEDLKAGQNDFSDEKEISSKVSPSPKPKIGLLAFFSRAEVKEGSSEVTAPVKEEVSCPTEEEACYEKTTPVDDEVSYPIEDKVAASPAVPEVLSEAQATLSVENQCAVGLQSEYFKAGQNDFSDKKEISSKVSPSPKPKRGLLAFFSRAEVKEGSSEVIAPVKEEVSCPTEEEACYEKITPVDDEVSYPIEDKVAASPDVPEVLSEAQAITSVKDEVSCCTEEAPEQQEESRPAPADLTCFDHNTLNINDLSHEKTDIEEQCIHSKDGESDLFVKHEGETSPKQSTGSITSVKIQGFSQGADSTDVSLIHEAHVLDPSPRTSREQEVHAYTPPLKLSSDQQNDETTLLRNLRALWEEEKNKLTLGVTEIKVTTDVQEEQGGAASAQDTKRSLSASQHDLQTVLSDLHQDHGLRSSSLNRGNTSYDIKRTGRESVTESKSQSPWKGDTFNQPGALQETKKQSSSAEAKSLGTTNLNQMNDLNTDKSTLDSQQKSQTKANPLVNLKIDRSLTNQEESQTKGHGPKDQSKILRKLSKLDRSPLKTFVIDIGLMKRDKSTSEDHSTTSIKHSTKSSSVERQSPSHHSRSATSERAGNASKVTAGVSRDSSPLHHSQLGSVDLGSSRIGKYEDTNPVLTIFKRASRPMSLSKSLEDITKMPAREERMRADHRSDLMLSADDVSTTPSSPASSPDPEQMKRMSASVPAFLQDESDDKGSDYTSDSSFYSPHKQKRKFNSHTNYTLPPGMPSLSSSVSSSVMSIYSGDISSVDVQGTIQFALTYVDKLGEFHIFVAQCKDLAVAEPKRTRSDPYVKCYLLPDKAKLGKRKTSVKKKTLNPTFNEILRYKISFDTLKTTTLNLSVWHNDNFGRNSFLGEVDVDLREWNIIDTHMKQLLLRPRVVTRPMTVDQRGHMRVALRFIHQVTLSKRASKSGEVQICVKECKNLPVVRGTIIDPFVKCTVLPDTSRKGRQKTQVVKKTADPVFNHTMVYDGFRPEDLREVCVELTVWDHDRLNNHFLGGLRLGLGTGKSYDSDVDWMDSTFDEASLWNQMMNSQGEWVEDVLPLRMLMMARSTKK